VSIIGTMFTSSVYSPEYDSLRNWLTQKRIDSGYTIRSLAEALDVNYSTIGKIEAGQRKIDVIEFMRFCRAVGADPNEGLLLLEKRHRI
jgi:transcriptional regulator with XRE-family HTH domain